MRKDGFWAFILSMSALVQTACFLPPANPSQRLSEAAHNMSMMTRFGRTDAALDFVDPSEKQAFAKRRAPWEKELRVLDVELVDLRLQSKEEADVVMTVLWQRFNEAEVRETQVTQRWRDSRKGWKLLSESAESGDRELLAEPAADAKSSEKAGPAKKL